MRRPRFRPLSFSIYIFTLSITDSLVLMLNSISRRLIGYLTGVQLTLISVFSCKLLQSLHTCTSVFSSWVLSAVILQRVVAVALPHKANLWFSVRRAWITVALLFVFIAATIGALTFTVQTHTLFYGITICYHDNPFLGVIYTWTVLLAYSFIPSAVIIICNIILTTKVSTSHRFRQIAGMTLTSDERKMIRLTIMLVITSTFFVLLTIPKQIFMFYSILHTSADLGSSKGYANYILLSNIQVSNHAINGYIYCFSGPMFREELYKMFYCGARKNVELGIKNKHTPQNGKPGQITDSTAKPVL